MNFSQLPRSSASVLLLRIALIVGLLMPASPRPVEAANGTWNVNADGTWSTGSNWLNGIIADGSSFTANFTLNITADRTITLDGNRTLGKLVFSDGGSFGSWWNIDGPGILTLAGSSTPTITTTTNTMIRSILAGSQGLTHNGGAALVLVADNTYTGLTTNTSGSGLQFGAGGTTGSITGNIANSGRVYFNYASGTVKTYGGNISGVGALQIDSGTVQLTGTNSNSGETRIAGSGVLRAVGGVGLSNSSNLVLSGGGVYEGSGTFTRSIGSAGGQVSWDGAGGFSAAGGDLSVNLGGAGQQVTWSQANFVQHGSALVLGSATADAKVTIVNPWHFNGQFNTVQVNDNAGSTTDMAELSGNIGSGGLLKTGAGTLILSGDNGYLFGTTIFAGTLETRHTNALGLSTTGIAGGTLKIAAGQQLYARGIDFQSGALTGGLNSSVLMTSGDFRLRNVTSDVSLLFDGANTGKLIFDAVNNGTATLSGSVNLGGVSRTIDVGNGSADVDLVLSGVVTNGMLIKNGAGTLALTNANDYAGNTTISGGTLQIGNGGTSGNINGTVTNNGTLTFNRSDEFTFANQIIGRGGVVQRGTGTTILTGTSTFTGSTVISGGTLKVAAGGVVNDYVGVLGQDAGTNGTATVSGNGSQWNNSADLYVGYFGSGTLNIQDGGVVANTFLGYVGGYASSTGTATVTGSGSQWNNSRELYIGYSGSGTLNLQAGGVVANTFGYLGLYSGSTGTATVTGSGSQWSNSQSLYVGGSSSAAGGTGLLTVADGGAVSIAQTLKLWNAGTLTMNGGSVTTQSFDRSVGTFNFNDGTLTVNGGTYTHASGTGGSANILTLNGSSASYNPTLKLQGNAAVTGVEAVVVGSTNQATLEISGGRVLNNTGTSVSLGTVAGTSVNRGFGYLGLNANSGGTVTVNGTGSQWSNSQGLYVGNSGSGTLNVQAGGVVANTFGYLGFDSGSTGTVTVSGTGSRWNNSQDLQVGYAGNGTLNIQAGGVVANTNGYLANNSNSRGTATVTGSGSQWNNSQSLYVGGSSSAAGGTALLNVLDGGVISVTDTTRLWQGIVNVSTGSSLSTGVLDVRGGTFNLDGSLTAGQVQMSAGNIGGGGTLSASSYSLQSGTVSARLNGGALTKAGSGTLILSGLNNYSGGTTIIQGILQLSGGANRLGGGPISISGGTLILGGDQSSPSVQMSAGNIGGGGMLSAGSFSLQSGTVSARLGGGALTKTGSGTVILSGANTYSGGTTINGGVLSISHNNAFPGSTAVSVTSGTLDILTGISLSSLSLAIGGGADAAFVNIPTGASFALGESVQIQGNGTLNIDGNLSSQSVQLSLGTLNFNRGTLTVNGGAYTHASGTGTSANILTLNGSASTYNPTLKLQGNAAVTGVEAVVVGPTNQATLEVSGGRVLNNTGTNVSLGTVAGTTIFRGSGHLGLNANSGGTVTVNGSGSQWNNSQNLYVGNKGSGTLNVLAGGVVTNSVGYLGNFSGSTGTATVTGSGSQWNNSSSLIVGGFVSGTLNVQAGGVVTNTVGLLGISSGSTGTATVTVTGSGSQWNNSSHLYVGDSSSGTLNVQDGGVVANTVGLLGNSSGSTGTATVTGSGSQWNNSSSLYVGGNPYAAGGTGQLTVADGGAVSVGGTLKLWDTGTLTMNGGSVTTQSFDRSVGTFNFNDGTLTVNGGTYTHASGTGGSANILTLNGSSAGYNPTLKLMGNPAFTGVLPKVEAVVVGSTNQATLEISAGRVLNNTGTSESLGTVAGTTIARGYGYLGLAANSNGTATVSGSGSQWNNSQDLRVGFNGNGTLYVQAGGVAGNTDGYLGINVNSSGTAIVTGNGSQWNNSQSLYVGGGSSADGGTGLLTVADGGTVSVGGTLKLWSSGTLSLQTGGTVQVQNIDFSQGTLQFSGGTLSVSGSVTAPANFTLDVTDKTFINNGTLTAPVLVGDGGLVKGSGSFSDVNIDGGSFSPGNSPGTTPAPSGSTTWTSGEYVWEINRLAGFGGTAGANPGWDLWNTGALTINATSFDPFRIVVDSLNTAGTSIGALDNWDYTQNYSWKIATASNANVFSDALAAQLLSVDLSSSFFSNNPTGGGTFYLSSSNSGLELYLDFEAAAVPEPSSIALVGGVVLTAVIRRRRRNVAAGQELNAPKPRTST